MTDYKINTTYCLHYLITARQSIRWIKLLYYACMVHLGLKIRSNDFFFYVYKNMYIVYTFYTSYYAKNDCNNWEFVIWKHSFCPSLNHPFGCYSFYLCIPDSFTFFPRTISTPTLNKINLKFYINHWNVT